MSNQTTSNVERKLRSYREGIAGLDEAAEMHLNGAANRDSQQPFLRREGLVGGVEIGLTNSSGQGRSVEVSLRLGAVLC